MNNLYKSIPSGVILLSFIALLYREFDFHLFPLLTKQKHFVFLIVSLVQLLVVTVYASFYVHEHNNSEMRKKIGSFFIG